MRFATGPEMFLCVLYIQVDCGARNVSLCVIHSGGLWYQRCFSVCYTSRWTVGPEIFLCDIHPGGLWGQKCFSVYTSRWTVGPEMFLCVLYIQVDCGPRDISVCVIHPGGLWGQRYFSVCYTSRWTMGSEIFLCVLYIQVDCRARDLSVCVIHPGGLWARPTSYKMGNSFLGNKPTRAWGIPPICTQCWGLGNIRAARDLKFSRLWLWRDCLIGHEAP